MAWSSAIGSALSAGIKAAKAVAASKPVTTSKSSSSSGSSSSKTTSTSTSSGSTKTSSGSSSTKTETATATLPDGRTTTITIVNGKTQTSLPVGSVIHTGGQSYKITGGTPGNYTSVKVTGSTPSQSTINNAAGIGAGIVTGGLLGNIAGNAGIATGATSGVAAGSRSMDTPVYQPFEQPVTQPSIGVDNFQFIRDIIAQYPQFQMPSSSDLYDRAEREVGLQLDPRVRAMENERAAVEAAYQGVLLQTERALERASDMAMQRALRLGRSRSPGAMDWFNKEMQAPVVEAAQAKEYEKAAKLMAIANELSALEGQRGTMVTSRQNELEDYYRQATQASQAGLFQQALQLAQLGLSQQEIENALLPYYLNG